MRQPTAGHLATLSRLIRRLERKRVQLEEVRRVLERVQRTGLVVRGESLMLGELEDLETEAGRLLDALERCETAQEATRQLEELEDLVSRPEWELAPEMLADLQEREARLAEMRRELEDQIADWRQELYRYEEILARAKRLGAPVVREEALVWRLRNVLSLAERALQDSDVGRAAALLADLDEMREIYEPLSERIAQKAEEAGRFSQRATMNLLQARLPDSQYQYTVLVNLLGGLSSIEGSSTLQVQDLELVGDEIGLVTAHLNRRLARQFEQRAGHPLVDTPAHPPSTPADALNVESGSPARHLRPASEAHAEARPSDPNEQVHHTGELVARLFVPENVRSYLRDTPCSVMIATNDLDIPWELMRDRGQFLCLSRPVGRMPTGYAPQAWEPTAVHPGYRARFLLVYADPANNLPAARREVEAIQDGVNAAWPNMVHIDVLKGTEASSGAFSRALYRGGYDVIHFAGHAAFNAARPDLSGLLLHDGTTCYAQKIRRLTSGRPLVFLNACETGRSADDEKPQQVERYLQRPVEGLASALIYGGAVGCIGALWPIFDPPAADFAIEFYTRLLEGYMLGEAMRQARLAIQDRYPEQITWAAYVLYGDPTYRMVE